ncbi:DUF6894 family protein [Rhizobium glycinendophyticum]|uniref:DUF6894 family protein n=1 Tax=Rhizobium glycinendophyticum TaxID=2589807 RepID=UPI003CCC7AF2
MIRSVSRRSGRLQRYFFHAVFDGNPVVDVDGIELENPRAARASAVDGIRDIVAEAIRQGLPCAISSVEIRDSSGELLDVVRLGEAVKVPFEQLSKIIKRSNLKVI